MYNQDRGGGNDYRRRHETENALFKMQGQVKHGARWRPQRLVGTRSGHCRISQQDTEVATLEDIAKKWEKKKRNQEKLTLGSLTRDVAFGDAETDGVEYPSTRSGGMRGGLGSGKSQLQLRSPRLRPQLDRHAWPCKSSNCPGLFCLPIIYLAEAARLWSKIGIDVLPSN